MSKRSRSRLEDGEHGPLAGIGGSAPFFTKRQLAPCSSTALKGVVCMPDAKSAKIVEEEGAAQVGDLDVYCRTSLGFT